MTVIADLHGGDPEDLVAKAEFQEIKDRVIYEVRYILTIQRIVLTLPSVNRAKAGRTL